MTDLVQCATCSELIARGTCVCPLCGDKACSTRSVHGAALLLGLSLAVTGCGDKDGGTGTPTGTAQPEYGVPTSSRTVDRDEVVPEMVSAIAPPECEQ